MTGKVTFGSFTLDADRRQLYEGAREVHLTPKAYELLVVLIKERPRALSKTELHQLLWPDTFVGDATLARLVADLRAALGTGGHDEGMIRTIHGFGYAFDAELTREPDTVRTVTVPPVSWTWFETPDGERRLPLHDGDNHLGRSAAAEVCLDDSTVSRHHARIVVTASGATVEDLGSRNGTFVNDAPAASSSLRDGDEVKVGSVRLRFRTLLEPGSTTVSAERPAD